MFYKYKITYFNSSEECIEEGIVSAINYFEATRRVVEDYGEENISNIYLQDLCIEGKCINKDEIDEAFMSH